MSLRAYIDTSVFGGYFDAGFDEASRRFFEMVEAKRILPLISDVLLAEVGRAPESVRDLLGRIIAGGIERLAATEEAIELQ
jgi:predicted nucleic acid-binding protein